jgi:hypothetical protein
MQERSAPRDIDESEVPDIGVPSIGVDGVDEKSPKDDGSSATEFRLARRSLQSSCQSPVSACNFPVLLKLAEVSGIRAVKSGTVPWTLDKLRQSLSVNVQCRRETRTVRVDSLNRELGAQFWQNT